MKNEYIGRLIQLLPRHMLLDLMDMTVARARETHELIRDKTPLKGKSARGAEGQLRFRMLEEGFQRICESYGGRLVENCLVDGADMRFHQPFMRFGGEKAGMILGLASMPTKTEMPNKNKSREAGVSLNYHVSPRLELDGSDPKPGDVFVLFLAARNPGAPGEIAEIAIGVIDSDYSGYVFYEPIETFMARYAQPAETESKPETKLVKLKTSGKAFRPPEAPEEQDNETEKK